MALDKHHAPPGMEAVENESCDGCAFQGTGHCYKPPKCCPCCRPDGCSVIYVHSSVEATASWPYDSEGTPVEVE